MDTPTPGLMIVCGAKIVDQILAVRALEQISIETLILDGELME
jgi:3-phosphoglycerate kinase